MSQNNQYRRLDTPLWKGRIKSLRMLNPFSYVALDSRSSVWQDHLVLSPESAYIAKTSDMLNAEAASFAKSRNPWHDQDIEEWQIRQYSALALWHTVSPAIIDSFMQLIQDEEIRMRMFRQEAIYRAAYAISESVWLQIMNDRYLQPAAQGLPPISEVMRLIKGKKLAGTLHKSLPDLSEGHPWAFFAAYIMPYFLPLKHKDCGYDYTMLLNGLVEQSTEENKITVTQHYRNYRHWQPGFEHEVMNSFDSLGLQINQAYVEQNSLKGVAAKQKCLLVDESVPLPTIATFLAWWQICGLNIFSDIGRSIANDAGFASYTKRNIQQFGGVCLHYMQYITPSLPVTQEHASGSAIADAESHANHSLNAKSAGHERDEHEGLLHGKSHIRLVGLGVYHRPIADLDLMAVVLCEDTHVHDGQRVGAYWHQFESLEDQIQFPEEKLDAGTKGGLLDPYHGDAVRLPYNWAWQDPTHQANLGLRAYARQYNTYFRFDSRRIERRWCVAFETAANEWLKLAQATTKDSGITTMRVKQMAKENLARYDVGITKKSNKLKGKVQLPALRIVT